jgi:hypothetical protein
VTRCALAAALLCKRGFIWVVVKTGAKKLAVAAEKEKQTSTILYSHFLKPEDKKTACKTCQKTQTIGIFLNFGVGRV